MKRYLIPIAALVALTVPMWAYGQQDRGGGTLAGHHAAAGTADVQVPRTGGQSVVPDPFVKIGETMTYTWTVVNSGPDAATDVTFTSTLAAGISFVSASGCADSGGVQTCGLGTLAAGASVVIVIVARLDAGECGSIVFTVGSVSASSTDPVATNNSITEASAVSCGQHGDHGDHGTTTEHTTTTTEDDHHGTTTSEHVHETPGDN